MKQNATVLTIETDFRKAFSFCPPHSKKSLSYTIVLKPLSIYLGRTPPQDLATNHP